MLTARGLLLVVTVTVAVYGRVAAQDSGVPIERFPVEKAAEELHRQHLQQAEALSRITRESRVVTKGIFAPSVQDRFEHERFLDQANTGLLRLLPREIYDWRTYHTPRQIELRGGGAYYSFFHRSHEYGYVSDLELDHNRFTVGFAGADYGMLAAVDYVGLDQVDKDDRAFSFIAQYKPAILEENARLEFRKFAQGVTVDGITYKRTLPVRVNTTYLLRSIVYGTSDVFVAFQVSRIDPDGSVIIAWKLLRSFDPPKLQRN